ncbi:hypothetical protein CDD83_947 [Cordyceps sp. RAO-2017]|nr:hypothetical protein CDD83_947 [Cordyceps sp. RAO-2017]
MRASGEPNEVMRYCPEDRAVDCALSWYHLPDCPAYFFCTRCYVDSINGTPLASQFQRVQRPAGSSSTCGFWSPRVKEKLWPEALRSNSLDSLRTFIRKRVAVPNCKGRGVVVADEGVSWYGMAAGEINGFIACEACYEDRVKGTAFESRFTAYQKQKADEKWICDIALPYVSRAAACMSRRNDWAGFVAGSVQRLQQPECEGMEVSSHTRKWYSASSRLQEAYVCEACYMDKLALTPLDPEFECQSASGFDAFMEALGQRRTCMLPSSSIPMAFALENALRRGDCSIFWNAAQQISKLVPCTANGIIRGNWWTLRGGCDDLSVCEACFVGILQTTEVDMFFQNVQRNREATIVCNFCVASPRFSEFIGRFAQALDQGVFICYSEYARKFAGVTPCPGLDHREGATWWGYPEILFCHDCYLCFVAGSQLADTLPIKGERDDRAHICQIWSPRMRKMWLDACAAGDPASPESQKAVAEFRKFGSERLSVYLKTVPQIKFIRNMQQLKMMNGMHQGMLSVMYSGMNSQAVLSGTTDGYEHGNSSLGWYETEHGATSAQMRNNMQASMADANRPDQWMQIFQLEALWREVE